MRSKTEWSIESDGKGKQKPVRVGLAPEQGKGIEYEFDLLLEISPDHIGRVIKDRTGKFQDELLEKPGEEFGKALAKWLAGTGKSASTTDTDGTGDPDTKANTKRSRKTSPEDEAAEPPSPAIPADEASREALIEEAVQEQVERLIARAAKVGAWGQAEEYCRARFTGPHLAYALAELRDAEEEARRKRAARQAA
jgi:hypothetical protein